MTSTEPTHTRYEIRDRAAWITLDSSENRNALSAPLVAELGAVSARWILAGREVRAGRRPADRRLAGDLRRVARRFERSGARWRSRRPCTGLTTRQ